MLIDFYKTNWFFLNYARFNKICKTKTLTNRALMMAICISACCTINVHFYSYAWQWNEYCHVDGWFSEMIPIASQFLYASLIYVFFSNYLKAIINVTNKRENQMCAYLLFHDFFLLIFLHLNWKPMKMYENAIIY